MFEAVRKVVRSIQLKQDLNILVQQVAYTLEKFYDQKFKWNMIRQMLKVIRRWVLKHKFDIWLGRDIQCDVQICPKIFERLFCLIITKGN